MLEQSRKAVELPHVNHAAAPFFLSGRMPKTVLDEGKRPVLDYGGKLE